jgi:glucosamine-6-phosphate deaminase
MWFVQEHLPLHSTTIDSLKVKVYADRRFMGQAAGGEVAARLKQKLKEQRLVRMIFAAAPSQLEMLARLAAEPDIDWSRVTAFHMDEYIGLPPDSPQLFSRFLQRHLFDKVKPGSVHPIDSTNDPEAECRRYAALLQRAPIDIVCLGIGENGHLAFNDPPVADFDDPKKVKIVELDETCRRQQVNDGCFPTLEDVPVRAITLTIPALMAGAALFCTVPGPTKRNAVRQTLHGPVSEQCPASILRRHPHCTLYLDRDAYGDGEYGA